MKHEIDELLSWFEKWIDMVQSMHNITEDIWDSSIEDGKWSIRDIVSHMMMWDEYFYEEGIRKVVIGEKVTVKHLSYDEFNSDAIKYGRTVKTSELIDKTISIRKRIIKDIRSLSEEQIIQDYEDGDGNVFNVIQYVKDFLWHDHHHIRPLKEYLIKTKTWSESMLEEGNYHK